MDFLKGTLEVLKLAPRYLVALALAAGLLVFLPESVQKAMGMAGIIAAYRGWFGVALVVAISALAVWIFIAPAGAIRRWWQRRARKRRIIDRLHDLTEAEKQILRYYLLNNTRSNRLRHDDGTAAGLLAIGVLYVGSRHGDVLSGFDHNISQVAWDHLRDFPELLVGETNTARTDARRRYGVR